MEGKLTKLEHYEASTIQAKLGELKANQTTLEVRHRALEKYIQEARQIEEQYKQIQEGRKALLEQRKELLARIGKRVKARGEPQKWGLRLEEDPTESVLTFEEVAA